MNVLIEVLVPVFAIILAGYLGGRYLNVLGSDSSRALNGFVFYFALPPLLFAALARVDPGSFFHGAFIAAFLGGQALVFIPALALGLFFFRKGMANGALFAMASSYGNTGHLGIPLSMFAFGDSAVLPAIIATVLTSTVVVAIVMTMIEVEASDARGSAALAGHVIRNLFRNPLLVAPAAGAVWAAFNQPLPEPLGNFCDLMGKAAGPCALFALGLFLSTQRTRPAWGEVGLMSLFKLGIQPAATYWLAFQVFELEPLWAGVCVVTSALPSGVGLFIVAQQYGRYEELSSAAILTSTLISIITLSVLLPNLVP
ncbi:MAG TPA: AEC family transporter [Rhodospirillales bacterium]|jgi:hypothetical protein|nr:AEC family transporter [Rhodospirillales bacterium]